MMMLGEHYDEYYGLDEYDPYNPFECDDIVTYCDIHDECSECPRCGDTCDGREDDDAEVHIDKI